MTRAIRFASWCAAVWILSGPSWGQSAHRTSQVKQPSANKTTGSESEQRGTKEAPFFVHIEKNPKEGGDSIPAKQDDSQHNFYEGLSAWSALGTALLTGFLVAVGAGGICAALKTLKAIERQANLMQAQHDQWPTVGSWKIQEMGLNRVGISVEILNPSYYPVTITGGSFQIEKDQGGRSTQRIRQKLTVPPNGSFSFFIHYDTGVVKEGLTVSFIQPAEITISHQHRITKGQIGQRIWGRLNFGNWEPGKKWGIYSTPYAEMDEQEEDGGPESEGG